MLLDTKSPHLTKDFKSWHHLCYTAKKVSSEKIPTGAQRKLAIMAHFCKPNTLKAEAVIVLSWEASLGYRVRLCLKNK